MVYSIKGIHHIQLAAPKGAEDKSREFFSQILGFKEVEKPEALRQRGGVWFEFGRYQIHIGIEEPFIPAKKAHPGFEVENLEALKAHLIQHQIEVVPDSNLPGAARFYAYDFFGNRLEFLEWIREE